MPELDPFYRKNESEKRLFSLDDILNESFDDGEPDAALAEDGELASVPLDDLVAEFVARLEVEKPHALQNLVKLCSDYLEARDGLKEARQRELRRVLIATLPLMISIVLCMALSESLPAHVQIGVIAIGALLTAHFELQPEPRLSLKASENIFKHYTQLLEKVDDLPETGMDLADDYDVERFALVVLHEARDFVERIKIENEARNKAFSTVQEQYLREYEQNKIRRDLGLL